MNNTIELLDTVKDNLRYTFSIIYHSNNYMEFNDLVSNDEFRECIMIIKKIALEKGEEIPYFLSGCRTVEEFLRKVYIEIDSRNEMLEVISNAFNPYIFYLEENMYEVEIVKVNVDFPKILTYVGIVRDLDNCDSRIEKGDYSGAITSAKTLVEGVCKELLTILGEDTSNAGEKFPKLVTRTLNTLNLDASNEAFTNQLKEIVNGLNKTIVGLNEVRNTMGDSHSKTFNPSFHHAVLAVNSAKTVTSFLFHTYEYQKEKGTIKINK
ncbi:abortive infection family protein [Planococcus donghaensis]|uniref:abortive infection family protein n=1 Tax=Planococcus donghaensis TaxID=414778 RepID=UPI0037358713